MVISSVNKQTFVPGETLTINGRNLFSVMYDRYILLMEGVKETTIYVSDDGSDYSGTNINLGIRTDQEIGTYQLKVRLDDFDSVTWPTPVSIDFPNHTTTISSVTTEKQRTSGDPALFLPETTM